MKEVTPKLPFRWDLARREQLGRLIGAEARLWSDRVAELERCAAHVLARSDDSDLYFVGRSAESLFDYLSGVFSGRGAEGLRLLPFSMRHEQRLSRLAIAQLRANLTALGLAPQQLTRRRRKVAFVDLVYLGGTFANLVAQLHDWVEEGAGGGWGTVREKLRLVGITSRTKTSPKTWRWHQHADWAALLPRRAIVNVSLDARLWAYFGNDQHKVSESLPAWRWDRPAPMRPRHDANTRAALAEAVAYYDLGRDPESRARLVRLLAKEPAFREPWLRTLTLRLGRGRRA